MRPRSHLRRRFTVTFWVKYARGNPHSYFDWRCLVDDFVGRPQPAENKHDVGGYSIGTFEDDRRKLANVIELFALTFDHDDGSLTVDGAAKLWRGYRSVSHTTWSSTPKHPKTRTIVLLNRPVDAEEYERLWLWGATRCARHGHAVDTSARDPSRLWFVPSCRSLKTYASRETAGRVLDVDRVLKVVGRHTFRPFPGLAEPIRRGNGRGRGPSNPIASAHESFWGAAFEALGKTFGTTPSGALAIECPWSRAHSPGGFDGDTSTAILPPTSQGRYGLFRCLHNHCSKRTSLDLLDALPAHALASAREKMGAGFARATVTGGYLERLSAFGTRPELHRWRLQLADADGVVLPSLTITLPSPGYEGSGEFFEVAWPGLRFSRALLSMDEWRRRGLVPIGREIDVVIAGGRITSIVPRRSRAAAPGSARKIGRSR